MSQKAFSQQDFYTFLTDTTRRIEQVRDELDEIQAGFTTSYTEFRAKHDATLSRLTNLVLERLEDHQNGVLNPALHQKIDQRFEQERKAARQRREELRTLIPQREAELDRTLEMAREQERELRRQNPVFDQREEKLKAEIDGLREEIQKLDRRLKSLNRGCLGFLLNFQKIDRVDRQRQQLIGRVRSHQESLYGVRVEWQQFKKSASEEQARLQQAWTEQNLALANLRSELEHLEEDARLEELARKRAVFKELDGLKSPDLCEQSQLEADLRQMLVLNHQTDNYHEGLTRVAGLIALLDSLQQGMKLFSQSVRSVIDQQRQHSAHLPPLTIALPSWVVEFHQFWEPLRQQVRDEARLGKVPLEFVDTVRPAMEKTLTESTIERMFNELGDALNAATRAWG
jgi:chromosome segregation ATPase